MMPAGHNLHLKLANEFNQLAADFLMAPSAKL